MDVLTTGKGGQRVETRQCLGGRCLTLVPTDRLLCYFCSRESAEAVKQCYRCHEIQPLVEFAYGGNCIICDNCRWSSRMTPDERNESRLQSERRKRKQERVERMRAA